MKNSNTTIQPRKTCWALLSACCLSASAFAGTENLEFQLVTRAMDVKTEKVASVEGQMVGMGRYAGTAFFKDGRVANKEFIFNFDFNKGSGPFFGYSTYTFADGSALVMRFDGNSKAGQPMEGAYTILSGSGIYAGASGSGSFKSSKDAWKSANLYTGNLKITTP